MKISGFTYLRNGFKMGCPFIPSILSLLTAVDELVVTGDPEDGAREAIEDKTGRRLFEYRNYILAE